MTASRYSLPNAPEDLDARSAFEPFEWFQRWEVFPGIFTPGTHDIAALFREFSVPDDLTGKRVLDVGAWNGCIAFECERRGASEVIALGPEDPDLTGFYELRKLVGSSRTRYKIGSIYALDPRELGFFDLIFFCGVLYHLRYPLLGIDNLRRVARGDVYVNSVMQRSRRKTKGKSLDQVSLYLESVPSWRFLRHSQLNEDYSNWFVPNRQAILEAFGSAGFEIHFLKKGKFKAVVKGGLPEFLALPCCESRHYSEVLSRLFHPHAATVKFDRTLASLAEWGNRLLPESAAAGLRRVHRSYRHILNTRLKYGAFAESN